MRPALILSLLLLCACAAQGGFPSLAPRPAELDRAIVAPDAGTVPGLTAEERQSVADDHKRAGAGLAAARRDIADAERAMAASLPAARNASIGSEPWARAQMLLSRFQDARSRLAAIDASLSHALLLTDSLPDDDADRQAIIALRAEIAAEDTRTGALAASVAASLAGG